MLLSYVLFGTVIPLFLNLNETMGNTIYQSFSAYLFIISYLSFYITFAWKLRQLLTGRQINSELSNRNFFHVGIRFVQ